MAALSVMSRSSAASTRLNSAMMRLEFLHSERSLLDFQLLHADQSLLSGFSGRPFYRRAAQLGDEIQR